MAAIDTVRALIGVATGKDALLAVLVDNATAEFCAYCNRSDVPTEAAALIPQIAVLRYNAIGTEGLSAQSFSGSSESYCQEYPEHIRRALNRFRKAAFL